ncbi:hypothetical protein PR202_ga19999 [Eleusine coracana subsp. coracana]|uniref:Uncharacterized protein n=1 Tax=Eleusine coracana subsp. coracana TaxID=191504 RepID=A0AAV5CX35_ELECO|nr:hypothetical protein PR202_ga19999 [Eleusine coracana subsp. coracana]
MTPLQQSILVVAAAAACFFFVADGFTVTGEVYCDPCRAGFKTNVSTPMAGAAVKLECRPFLNGPESLEADATTDAKGWYLLEVDQDFQEDICEVMLIKSADPACAEIDKFRDRARIRSPRTTASSRTACDTATPSHSSARSRSRTAGPS